MKTQTNFSNLKRTGLTLLASMFIASLSAFAGNPESDMLKVENFMTNQTRMLKYVPADMMEREIEMSTARLDELFSKTEASLKYSAPERDETAEISDAIERLDDLASKTESMLRYKAPEEDETIDVYFELQSLDSLVSATDDSLKYNASEFSENEYFDYITGSNNDMVADLNQ